MGELKMNTSGTVVNKPETGTQPEVQGVKLTRKDLKTAFWRSLFDMSSINYERFQAMGFLYAMTPALKKLYPDKERRSAAMKRHLEMFNTNPALINPILGTTLLMEEKNANGEDTAAAINNIKVGLMGPFAGIGDSFFWSTLRPIFAGLGAALALQGSFFGPILFLLLWNVCYMGFRYWSTMYSYDRGAVMLKDMKKSNILQKISGGASVLGLMVLGDLVAQWVNIKTPIIINAGKTIIKLQDVLNSIVPCMLPLIATFILVGLLRKKITPNKLVLGIFIAALILSVLGIFAV